MYRIKDLKRTLAKPLTPLWICVFIDILGYTMITPYLPQFMIQMEVPLVLIGLLLSVNPMVGFFTNIIWGSLSDRIGRKPVMLICRAGTMAAYIILAFSGSLFLLMLARVVDGIFSRTVPIALTMAGDSVPSEQRSKEMSNVGAAWIAAGLIGPGIGGMLAESGMLWFGLFNAILLLGTIFITIFYIPESHPNFAGGVDENTPPEKKPAVSFALLKGFVPRRLLTQTLFNKVPYFMFAMTSSIYASERFGFTLGQIGILFTAISAANLVTRFLLFPRTLRTMGDKGTLRLGFFLYLIAFIWLSFASQAWEFFLLTMLMSYATSCAVDVMSGVMSNAVREDEMGEMMGLSYAAESFAMVVGPIIGSSLLGAAAASLYGLAGVGMNLIPIILEYLPVKKNRA